jgi:putative transposase
MEKKKRTRKPRMEDLIPDASIRQDVVSRLYQGDPILGDGGIFTDLLQSMVNLALEGEMDATLKATSTHGNRRNGHTRKKVRSVAGPLEISTPRDRSGDYEPVLVKKWERELGTGVDEIILSLYARGQSVDDVRQQLRQIYGLEVSAGVISAVTDRILPEILEWQQRPLASCYSIIYLDAIHYKVRDQGVFINKAIYSCYGVDVHGNRDVLGLYLNESEGSRQWGLILEDLQRRGVEDVLFFCVDGLTGFKQVIEQVFPLSIVQRCVVHLIRSSTRFVSYKDIRAVCADLKKIYSASDIQQAKLALEVFGQRWDKKYKEVRASWEKNWADITAFMHYGKHIRKMIYTTNPVEALHRVMRKVTKSKAAWCNDKALVKQLYLVLKYNENSWKKKAHNWGNIQRELIEQFKDRYVRHLQH